MNIKTASKIKLAGWAMTVALLPLGFFIFYAAGQTDTASPEVEALNRQIRDKRSQVESLEQKQKEYEAALAAKQAEGASLSNEIAILDNHLAKTQAEADALKLEMDSTGLEIKKTNLEIADKEESINSQKEHLASVIRVLYKRSQASSLEILLLNNSFSEFMNQVKYLGDVNGELADSLRTLETVRSDLEKDKTTLQAKLAKLDELRKNYDDTLASLSAQRQDKTTILAQVSNSETEYQLLIKQAKQEQASASADIADIERRTRQKLADKAPLPEISNQNGFIWPVPKNTITAFFHDPDYPFRYLFEHPAVDIRAPQSTPVRAAASGYVARAHDGGMGYSYIMLVHSDGLATVYGHVSKILVDEDDYVNQGQIIGLSGATPGTPGAGKLTSGPHLHFEVRLNGIPVNPLEYLP